MDSQFRTAAFGGFHRQDVMDYLERSAKEQREALQALQEKIDQLQKEKDEVSARLEESQTRTRVLTQECDECRREREREHSGRLAAEEKAEGLERRLALSEAEGAELRDRVAKLEPDAAAYAAVKERSAGIELEAHRRAQGVLDEAQEQARQLHQKMEQWLGRVGREYDQLCTQVDATVSHAAGELDKVRQSLDRISQAMAQQDGALDGLTQAYSQLDSTKVPAPVPLDETP